jgi:hypothetical protein
MIMGVPGTFHLACACDPAGAAKDAVALQADCRAVAAKMDSADAGLFVQLQGRMLLARLASDPVERERLEIRQREVRWLIHEGAWREVPEPGMVEEEIAMRLAGAGEMAVRRHIAAARGRAFSPDWQPPSPR